MASIYGGASGNGWKLRLDYTVTQDRAANTSSLRLRLYLYANTTGSYNLEKDSAYYVLQGQKVYQTYQYTAPGWYLLGERTVTVRHGADGNGSVQLGGQWVSDVDYQAVFFPVDKHDLSFVKRVLADRDFLFKVENAE